LNIWDLFTVIVSLAGLFFFFAGTLGLLRFPDVYSRLHALTKADNLGLGLIAVALVPQMSSAFDALQLLIIWVLVMISGAVAGFLIANHSLTQRSQAVSAANKQQDQCKDEC